MRIRGRSVSLGAAPLAGASGPEPPSLAGSPGRRCPLSNVTVAHGWPTTEGRFWADSDWQLLSPTVDRRAGKWPMALFADATSPMPDGRGNLRDIYNHRARHWPAVSVSPLTDSEAGTASGNRTVTRFCIQVGSNDHDVPARCWHRDCQWAQWHPWQVMALALMADSWDLLVPT
jgi:hypothetical protein